MYPPKVSRAKPDDRFRALSTLALAFCSDPLLRWMFPSSESYFANIIEIFDVFGGHSIDGDTCLITPAFEGAALWVAPGVETNEEEVGKIFEKIFSPHFLPKVGEMLAAMDSYHPHDGNCWYLPLIGVDPGHQNKGVGAALMKHMTEKLDNEGAIAYLESSNQKNISLYLRHGFEVIGEVQVHDSPIVTPMVRKCR
jgi:ribosomal protein S18 acetylase RimI-like enzyme